MLTKRVIPVSLVKGRRMFKGKQFASDRIVGNPMQFMKVNAQRGVDELCVLDVTATAEGRGPDLDLIRELSESVFVPLSIGGGIRALDDIDAVLRAGGDKVVIGAAAFEEPDFIQMAADRFGSQAIVCSLDVGLVHVMYRSGKVPAPWTVPESAAIGFAKRGAGEILLQSIDRDGMMCGYDLELIRSVSNAVSIPVIASGGCGTPEHMHEALQAGADAVAAGAMFLFTDTTPRDCAKHLYSKGWPIRL